MTLIHLGLEARGRLLAKPNGGTGFSIGQRTVLEPLGDPALVGCDCSQASDGDQRLHGIRREHARPLGHAQIVISSNRYEFVCLK